MFQVASTTASANPWVVTQPTGVLLAQPQTQFVMAAPAPAAEEKAQEEAAPPPPTIDPACLCFFAFLSALLLIAVAGFWTASFLMSSDMVFSLEGYKNSSVTWGFNNFSTKIMPAQFVPIGLKLIWWILLGFTAIYGLMAVVCHSRCNILLVCLLSLVNVIFFTILTADEGQVWGNAETNLKNQWKDDIAYQRFNFRGTGLSRIMYEYQCCGVDTGCPDFISAKDTLWLNITAGSGCFSANCNKTCSSMITRIKANLMYPFIISLCALILELFLFLSLLSMANQLARFTLCFTVEPGGGDVPAEE